MKNKILHLEKKKLNIKILSHNGFKNNEKQENTLREKSLNIEILPHEKFFKKVNKCYVCYL